MKKLGFYNVSMGADPEFFFSKNGKIIGSEKVLTDKGVFIPNEEDFAVRGHSYSSTNINSKFVMDGVQAELNPRPDTCRARFGNELSGCFRGLYRKMQENKGLKIDFSPAVKITKEELDTLDEKSKTFGCAPSKSLAKGTSEITVNPATYLYRAAGGHIHLAPDGISTYVKNVIFNTPEKLVAVLDILLGNTCVLIDRDKGNIERRKVYGKAGEYRTPKHGLEYRTLSNFWLRSYQLTSFVLGMARMSVSVCASELDEELISLINQEDIIEAINKNDLLLAKKNFNKIIPFIKKYSSNSFSLHADNLDAFEFFVRKGIDFWFDKDVLSHWITLPDGHTMGWERFLEYKVKPELAKVPKSFMYKLKKIIIK